MCSTTSSLGASTAVSMIVSSSRPGTFAGTVEEKYCAAVRFRTLRIAHQTKFEVKPPRRTTISLGRPVQIGEVPRASEASAIGAAASRAYAKQALITPENVA